jgi:hypothetical protein
MGGRGRVNGDDVDLFFGSNSPLGEQTTSIVTVAGKTRTSINGGPWVDVSTPVLGSSLWLGVWRQRPITDAGVVQRVGRPFHELKIQTVPTDPTGVLPLDAVVTARSTSVFVRDDGTPVSGHDMITATVPGTAGPTTVQIEVNYAISAIGIPQAIAFPSG